MFELEKKLIDVKDRLSFLVDFASFSPSEMRLNSTTFMWHGRMAAIFEEHRLIISEKKTQYEEALKVTRLHVHACIRTQAHAHARTHTCTHTHTHTNKGSEPGS